MRAHTKKLPTDEIITMPIRVHRSNVERVKRLIEAMEPEKETETITHEEFFTKYFPGESNGSVSLRGARGKENMSQVRLAELTGIPQRHISEMEHGKRVIGKETARKLAKALKVDYRTFL